MGFTTKGEDTKQSTFTERKDVSKWVEEFAEEQGWDLSDVRNRAIMYYAHQYQQGELKDPYVDDNVDDKATIRGMK